jgi:hypothetical protein
VDHVFQHVLQTLRPTGLFVFSVEHPVITSCGRAWQGVGCARSGLWIATLTSGSG